MLRHQKIISLKAAMDFCHLSDHLKSHFPNITAPISSTHLDREPLNINIDPRRVVGFTAGKGCFSVGITKSLTLKTGFQVQLRFNITQHSFFFFFLLFIT